MILKDFEGRPIRLTKERLRHILEHPEMREMSQAISETMTEPVRAVQS